MLSEAGVAVFIKDSNIILYNETKQGFDGKSPTLTLFIAFEEYIKANSQYVSHKLSQSLLLSAL